MKKEMIHVVITLIFMSVITILFLVIISFLAYKLKWQSSMAMYGITFTYILSGLLGGILFGWLGGRRNVAMAFLFGIVLASLYWGIPGGILMVYFQENISNMGRFASCFGQMVLSIVAGILIGSRMRRKVKFTKEGK